MTGQYQGVVTYLCIITSHLVYHVWCGTHQLDLVVQSATQQLLHGVFVQFVTNMTGNLQRQKNLILEMKTKNVHSLLIEDGCLWLKCYTSLMPIKSNSNNIWMSISIHGSHQCIGVFLLLLWIIFNKN